MTSGVAPESPYLLSSRTLFISGQPECPGLNTASCAVRYAALAYWEGNHDS